MSNARLRMMENFSRAAAEYDARAQFQHTETARVLDAALMLFPTAARIADIGCGTGYFAEIARTQRPDWNIVGVDIAVGMCAQAATRCAAIQADAVALPLADASCDAVVSSLCLQWVGDLPKAFAEISRVLKPNGRAVIASLGSESLSELRTLAKQATLPLGVLPMRAAEEYAPAITHAGLHTTMLKQEIGVDYYPDVHALLNSMRRIGAGNHQPQLLAPSRWKTLLANYEKHRHPKGIPATWDRLFMILHKPA